MSSVICGSGATLAANVNVQITAAPDLPISIASGKTLTLGNGTQTESITGLGNLRKNTSGTLTLSGANTYGSTTIDAGTLKAGTATTLPAAVTVGASGTLQTTTSGAAGKVALAGKLTVNGGTLRIGG